MNDETREAPAWDDTGIPINAQAAMSDALLRMSKMYKCKINCGNCRFFERAKWHKSICADESEQAGGYCEALLKALKLSNPSLFMIKSLYVYESFSCGLGRNGEEEPEDVESLIIRLRRYNDWRRGADLEQPDPNKVGKDIDMAIKLLKGINS